MQPEDHHGHELGECYLSVMFARTLNRTHCPYALAREGASRRDSSPQHRRPTNPLLETDRSGRNQVITEAQIREPATA